MDFKIITTLKKTVITLRSYSNKVKKSKIYPKQGVISLEMCFSFRISAEGPVGISGADFNLPSITGRNNWYHYEYYIIYTKAANCLCCSHALPLLWSNNSHSCLYSREGVTSLVRCRGSLAESSCAL